MFVTFGVVSLGPVVSGSRLSEDEVVWPEDLAVGSGPDRVHGAGLKIDEDSSGHILAAGSFVEVDVDALQLKEKQKLGDLALRVELTKNTDAGNPIS